MSTTQKRVTFKYTGYYYKSTTSGRATTNQSPLYQWATDVNNQFIKEGNPSGYKRMKKYAN